MKTKIDKLIRKRQQKIGGNVAKHRRICGSADGTSLGFFFCFESYRGQITI